MDLRNILAMNLKYYRYKLNMTQEEFYEKFDLNFKYMSRVENGKVNITIDTVEKLAQCLNIKPMDLITYNEKHVVSKKRVDSKFE